MRWRLILAFDFEVRKDNAFCWAQHCSLTQLEFNKDMLMRNRNGSRVSLLNVLEQVILVFVNI